MKVSGEVKTWNGVQFAGVLNGHTVCTATHPDMPNKSGLSRGRKIHLMKSEKLTFCNMLVDELAPVNYKHYSMTINGTCKNCLNISKNIKR